MILTYFPRLLCLSLACFFAAFAITWFFVAATQQWVLRLIGNQHPRRAANLLLSLRLLPTILALHCAVGLCVPSYMLFEPEIFAEPVGLACLAMACFALVICVVGCVRGFASLYRSVAFTRRCLRDAHETSFPFHAQPAWVIETSDLYLALTGILQPRIIISRGIVDALSDEELSIVLNHESAHRMAFDNLKRLFFRFAPGPASLERSWAVFAEYEADRYAVGNDQLRSLTLAAALVRVARFGQVSLSLNVVTAFLADGSQLSARVDRLLAPPEVGMKAAPHPSLKRIVTISLGLTLLPFFFHPFTLRLLHSVLERLL